MRNTPEKDTQKKKPNAWDRLTDDEKATLILINEAAKLNNERNTMAQHGTEQKEG